MIVPLFLHNCKFECKLDCGLGKIFDMVVWDRVFRLYLVWFHGVFGVDCLFVHWFILFLRRRGGGSKRDSFSKCQNVLQD